MIEKYDDKQLKLYLIYLNSYIFVYIYLNLKSEFSNVLVFKPNPSDPNKQNVLSVPFILSKIFFLRLYQKHFTQKSLVFKYFNEVFIFATLKIFICSVPPLALL